MKPTRKAELLVRHVDDELIVYDLEHHEAHCLNSTAAAVFELCDGERTPKVMAADLGYDEEIVLLALGRLQKLGLLAGADGISRRTFVRRAGIAAAVALPVITSLAVPTAAMAQSCLPDGSPCAIDADCCSMNCNNGICGPGLSGR